jgi:hypothetical protein
MLWVKVYANGEPRRWLQREVSDCDVMLNQVPGSSRHRPDGHVAKAARLSVRSEAT